MQIRVLFFASMAEHTNTRQYDLPLEKGATLSQAKAMLAEQFPDAAAVFPLCLTALNQVYATGDPLLQDGDELAIFPPVSGG